jgi:polygalacturonase
MASKSPILPLLAAAFLAASISVGAAQVKLIDAAQEGAVPDGKTLDTAAIQKAIDDCAADGGGEVHFPAGRYLTGTIEIKSHVVLDFDGQATLLGSTNSADYRNLDPFTDGNGHPMGYALIVAVDAAQIGITGKGTIDGQGMKLAANEHPFNIRPFLIRWVRCSDIAVTDIHLANPGAWTMHFSQSKNATVDGITIRCRDAKLQNNDGIDIDSSQHIKITNADIASEDDSLVIKSTGAEPSSDITASNCKLSTRTNAIKIGTESYGGFADINISNITVYNTDMSGIALNDVDGGELTNVNISDVNMDGVSIPITVRLGSRLKTFRAGDQPKAVGTLHDVKITNVSAKNVRLIGILINGVPGHPVQNLAISNVQIEVPGGGTADATKVQLPEKEKAYPEFNMFGKTLPAYGIYARHVDGMTLDNVKFTPLAADARPAAVFIDVQKLTPADFATQSK